MTVLAVHLLILVDLLSAEGADLYLQETSAAYFPPPASVLAKMGPVKLSTPCVADLTSLTCFVHAGQE